MIVVDENGNEISSTYEKRAKGLVKKGRARFIDENKICLIAPYESPCPPSKDFLRENILEDNIMDNKIIIDNGAEEMNTEPADGSSVTIDGIIARIDAISADKDYLQSAIESISLITDGNPGDCAAPGDIAGQAKAQALGKAVAAKEETNQRIIEFYTRVYKDLINSTMTYRDRILALIEEAINKGMDEKGISTILGILTSY